VRLKPRDRLTLVAGIASAQVRFAADRALIAAGVRARVTEKDVRTVPVVDTMEARAAAVEAAATCDVQTVLHSERSYRFAWLMSRYEGLDVDAEELYVASMLHDLGLGDKHRAAAEQGDFAVVGAEAANLFLSHRGWEAQRRLRVADAIGMHLTPRVPTRRAGSLARLLSLGPALDYLGFAAHRLDPAAVRAVLVGCPLPSDAPTILPKVNHGVRCRPAFLMGLGVGRFIVNNPLDRPQAGKG
jgi:hypothetical protein